MELKKEVAITIEEILSKIINENSISECFNTKTIKELANEAVEILFNNYENFRTCLLNDMEFEKFKKMSEENETRWSEFYNTKFSIKIKDKNTKENINIVFMYIIKEFEQKFFDWILNNSIKNKKE